MSHSLIRLPAAAKALGIDARTLRKRVADGTVPGYKLGDRLIYVDLHEITETLTQGTKS